MRIYGITGADSQTRSRLTDRLVAELAARGLRVSVLRPAPGDFDVDHPGKDSHRHRDAGATEVLVSSRYRSALMAETPGGRPPLAALLARLGAADLVLVEGRDGEGLPGIEVRDGGTVRAVNQPAMASDDAPDPGPPVFGTEDTAAIAAFILREVGLP